jgi:hypothetical protein
MYTSLSINYSLVEIVDAIKSEFGTESQNFFYSCFMSLIGRSTWKIEVEKHRLIKQIKVKVEIQNKICISEY